MVRDGFVDKPKVNVATNTMCVAKLMLKELLSAIQYIRYQSYVLHKF
jgi:hypothetical protein